jgi:hypothetical protein
MRRDRLEFCQSIRAFYTDALEEATRLGQVFARFVEQSPSSVMGRGTLERVLGADQLDAWLARTAQKQYTRPVLFSPVYDGLRHVVFRIKPSVRAAYGPKKSRLALPVSRALTHSTELRRPPRQRWCARGLRS